MKVAIYSPDGSEGWNIVKPDPRVCVLLDDRKVQRCIAADDEAGVVWVAAEDEQGNLRIDRRKQEVVLERLTGKVEIRTQ